ncbi:MAG: M20/M25/M40 family metallo-hydrolase, partial [Gammaproteobacteria bacterium]|nr:M20/M25/M40 family metallo-hydrolase [Gammaproteobacteria bacterium]
MSTGLPSAHEMIKELIATPSVSCVHTDLDMSNRGVIDRVAEWSEGLGFEIEIQSVNNDKFNLVARAGSGSDGLVLSGHTDTVPCDPSLWSSDPFTAREADDRIYGLGSCDMKSFLALALKASSGINFKDLKKPLTLVATADEETTMSGARLIADNGKKLGRFCVIGEPTGLSPIRQHKGNLTMSVEFVGQSGHASDPGLGNNALDGMHQFMTALYAYRDKIQ